MSFSYSPYFSTSTTFFTIPFKIRKITFGVYPLLRRYCPCGTLLIINVWLIDLKRSSFRYNGMIPAFFISFIISSFSTLTTIPILLNSLLGSIAIKVYYNTKGKNLTFQLNSLPKQLPSSKKITSYGSYYSVERL